MSDAFQKYKKYKQKYTLLKNKLRHADGNIEDAEEDVAEDFESDLDVDGDVDEDFDVDAGVEVDTGVSDITNTDIAKAADVDTGNVELVHNFLQMESSGLDDYLSIKGISDLYEIIMKIYAKKDTTDKSIFSDGTFHTFEHNLSKRLVHNIANNKYSLEELTKISEVLEKIYKLEYSK